MIFLPTSRISEIDSSLVGYITTQTNFYVSPVGSDLNDGLSAGSPFLTIQKAIDSIPTLVGGVVQINLADGTYTNSALITTPPFFARTGNSSFNTVVKIVGNLTTPANVIIRPPTATTGVFSLVGSYCYWDFDGFLIQNCGTAFSFNGSRGVIRAVNISQHRGCVTATNGSLVTSDFSASTPFVWDGVDNVAFVGITARSNSSVTISKTTTITGFSGTGRAINCDTDARVTLDQGATYTFTASTFGSRFGISGITNGIITVGGTLNISNVSTISSSTVGGIRLFASAQITFFTGATINFTNCYKAIVIEPGAIWNDLAVITVNYTTCTFKFEINHGGVANSANLVGATGSISYVAALNTNPIFGYDDRYVRVDRPTKKRTPIADIDYTVLLTDYEVSFTSLSAIRTVTLPTPSSAMTNISSGQTRYFKIKDESGAALTYPISIVVSGGATIDGQTSINLEQNFSSVVVYTNGTSYFIE